MQTKALQRLPGQVQAGQSRRGPVSGLEQALLQPLGQARVQGTERTLQRKVPPWLGPPVPVPPS